MRYVVLSLVVLTLFLGCIQVFVPNCRRGQVAIGDICCFDRDRDGRCDVVSTTTTSTLPNFIQKNSIEINMLADPNFKLYLAGSGGSPSKTITLQVSNNNRFGVLVAVKVEDLSSERDSIFPMMQSKLIEGGKVGVISFDVSTFPDTRVGKHYGMVKVYVYSTLYDLEDVEDGMAKGVLLKKYPLEAEVMCSGLPTCS